MKDLDKRFHKCLTLVRAGVLTADPLPAWGLWNNIWLVKVLLLHWWNPNYQLPKLNLYGKLLVNLFDSANHDAILKQDHE